MKQRKVLYITHSARGGSAVLLYSLAKKLDRSQYEPIVLFYNQENPYIGDKLAQAGIKTITLQKKHQDKPPVVLPREPVQNRDIARWLKAHLGEMAGEIYTSLKNCYTFIRQDVPKIRPIVRAIRENEIDLVHLNGGLQLSRAGVSAAWLTRTPCICHVHILYKLNYLDRFFARFVSSFMYISTAVAENYIAQGAPADRGTVIHNAVDLDEFSTDFDVTAVRDEFNWRDHERLVGVIGRLDWWKGHEYFLEAMAEVIQQISNTRGLIVGEPENTPRNVAYYQKLQFLTKSLNLDDKVVYTGFRSDIPRLMSALDVLVLSSSSPEPFGLVVIEGMAAGKPVVATAAGGVLDIIEHGRDGLLVPCKDSKAMAQAILLLLSDHEKAEQIARRGRQRVAQKFTLPRYAMNVQKLYDSVICKSGTREVE